MKRSELENNLIRNEVKELQAKISGKFTNEEWNKIVSFSLRWAGYNIVEFKDGSTGIIKGGEKLAMFLDVLGEIVVKDEIQTGF